MKVGENAGQGFMAMTEEQRKEFAVGMTETAFRMGLPVEAPQAKAQELEDEWLEGSVKMYPAPEGSRTYAMIEGNHVYAQRATGFGRGTDWTWAAL